MPAALDAARALTGVPADRCHTDLEAALAAAGADVAVAVVPPAAHREVATRCLEAGLPVLVEKPLAGTREDCLALVETAQRLGRELAVSQNYRYRRVIETARQVIASGRLGAIGQAQVDFRIHHDFRGTFRESMDDPLIVDMAVHHFDLIRFVTGLEASRVAPRRGTRRGASSAATPRRCARCTGPGAAPSPRRRGVLAGVPGLLLVVRRPSIVPAVCRNWNTFQFSPSGVPGAPVQA